MNNKYFRPRRAFAFSSHPYDLGIFTGLKQGAEDNHFLSKLWEMLEQEYESYYHRHLNYFLQKQSNGEQQFFSFVWAITQRRLKHYEDQDPFSSEHAKHMQRIERLTAFQQYLRSIDQWATTQTKDEIIIAKEEEIKNLKDQVLILAQDLKAAKKLDTEDFINIQDGELLTFVDLCRKMQKLELNGKELVFSQTQTVWVKMICKNFKHGNKEIKFDTIRRYFPGNPNEPSRRSAAVPAKSQHFQIIPTNKRS